MFFQIPGIQIIGVGLGVVIGISLWFAQRIYDSRYADSTANRERTEPFVHLEEASVVRPSTSSTGEIELQQPPHPTL